MLDEPTNHLDDEAAAVLDGAAPQAVRRWCCWRATTGRLLDAVVRRADRPGPGGARIDGRGGKPIRRWLHANISENASRRPAALGSDLRRAAGGAGRAAQATRNGTGGGGPGRGPRDGEKIGLGHTSGRVEPGSRAAQTPRSAGWMTAERDQVRKPPEPLRLRLGLAATGARTGVLLVRELGVAGRLRLDRLDVAASERLLVTGENGPGSRRCSGCSPAGLPAAAGTAGGADPRVGGCCRTPRSPTPVARAEEV